MMGSSFLTGPALTMVNVGLGLYSGLHFLKMIIQFGLPNHPLRFTSYMVSFCACFFFCTKAGVDLGLVSPFFWIKWRTLPLVAGGVALLLQTIMMIGSFTVIQQKVVSRLPLMAALLCFAFFPDYAEYFFGISLVVAMIFLTFSLGKARLQKRLFTKMTLFMGLYALFQLPGHIGTYFFGQIFLFGALFYFFVFQQTFGVTAMIEELK